MKITSKAMTVFNKAVYMAFDNEINIYEDTRNGGWGVNWGALGTQTIEKTYEFAENLKTASKLADWLNFYYIEIDWDMDEERFTDWDKAVKTAIKAGKYIKDGKTEKAMKCIFAESMDF